MKTTLNYRLIIHISIWSIVLLLPLLVSNAAHGYSIGFIPGPLFVIATLIHILLFYGHSQYLYPAFFNKKYWGFYIIVTLLSMAACNMLKMIITNHWFPDSHLHPQINTFLYAATADVYLISLAYCRIQHRLRNERAQKEREAAFLQSELRFLRSQISPHFLFNVLTNLVSLARKSSTQLEPSLIRLADLMRYMLYDTQDKKVPLQKEIEYLESYIELQKLRFGSDLDIQCIIAPETRTDSHTIEPMLLIPFVENAFKHGAGSIDQPSIAIHLSLEPTAITNNQKAKHNPAIPNPASRHPLANNIYPASLTLKVTNNFDPANQPIQDENSGIGLQNVKTRLEMLYKDNYTLDIHHDHSYFYITLKLNLS